VARGKIAAGAQRVTPGLTSIEKFSKVPLKRKETRSKVSGKKQTAYEYILPNDIGVIGWVG